jgi:hypothetical protein
MPFGEALFWISITILGTGMYFWLEHPQKLWGGVLTAVGLTGTVYSILRARTHGGPVVEPLRYDYDSDTRGEGLYLSSSVEPAYEVQVMPIPLLGEWELRFDNTLARVEREVFCAATTSRDGRHEGGGLDSVWRNLYNLAGLPGSFRFYIRYRAANERWYRSVCELHRDVTMHDPAFEVRFIRREVIGWFQARRRKCRQ